MKTALALFLIIAFVIACGCTTNAPPATRADGVPAPAAAPPTSQAPAGTTTLPAPSAPASGTPAGTVTPARTVAAAVQPMVTLRDHQGPSCAEMRLMSGAGCCGEATVYLMNESVCCGGRLYVNASLGCCGGSHLFSYTTEGCCNSTVYDLHTESCCTNRVVTGNCT